MAIGAMTKFITMIAMTLVTLKAVNYLEGLLNKLASEAGLLKMYVRQVAQLSVTKFIFADIFKSGKT
jgi:hypothetical protein